MNQKAKVKRQDPLARALARVVAVGDLIGDVLPAAMREAVDLGRQALAERDSKYRTKVLVIGETPAEAADWAQRNAIPGGAGCIPLNHGGELRSHTPPFTLIVLPGADRADDWARVAAQIAVLGHHADVIRMGRRPTAELAAMKVADDA